MQDFRTLEVARREQTRTIDLRMANKVQPFGIAFEGYFYAANGAEYTFMLTNDTGAMLFLHDIRVISEPLKNSAGKFTGSVRLSAGWHPVRLFYRHAAQAESHLELTCQQIGAGEYKLSPEVFSQAIGQRCQTRLKARHGVDGDGLQGILRYGASALTLAGRQRNTPRRDPSR